MKAFTILALLLLSSATFAQRKGVDYDWKDCKGFNNDYIKIIDLKFDPPVPPRAGENTRVTVNAVSSQDINVEFAKMEIKYGILKFDFTVPGPWNYPAGEIITESRNLPTKLGPPGKYTAVTAGYHVSGRIVQCYELWFITRF